MQIIDLRYEFNWNENNEKLDADINYVVEHVFFGNCRNFAILVILASSREFVFFFFFKFWR